MQRCPSCAAAIAGADRFCPACGTALMAATAAPATTPLGLAAPAPESAATAGGRFLPGSVLLGRYRLVALLGRGGMGEVYRADDLRLGQTVALKFLPDALARDADSRERFYAELRIGRQVSHPNVCRLYDLVEFEQQQALSMEYVDGEDLASLLRRLGRLPVAKGIEIARDLCAGLEAAHQRGVIHRDLKPGNVMIDGQGRARITDFGIAALIDRIDGEPFAGTPAYMAPELLDGEPASVRSDLYALGLILLEAFTGQPPAQGVSLLQLKQQRQQAAPSLGPQAAEIPAELRQLLLACLAPRPQDRPASAAELLAALPGGDPLQRALAAGETPTPAMVAAAGQVGDLRPWPALASLLAAWLGLLALLVLNPQSSLIPRMDPQIAPAVLDHRAEQLWRAIGLQPVVVGAAAGYFVDPLHLNEWLQRRPRDWSALASEQPGPLHYYRRSSPQPLTALQVRATLTAPAEVGRVLRDDPPMDRAGMAELVFDRRGQLLSLRWLPPVALPAVVDTPDWQPLLQASGLLQASLQPSAPVWTAPTDSDARWAWRGHYPGQPDRPLQVEAAALRGHPVWFEVIGPWRPLEAATPRPDYLPYLLVATLVFGICMYALVIALLARNLRQRRGDAKGALRLALAVFLASLFGLMLRNDHAGSLLGEIGLTVNIFSQAFYFAAVIWASYLAMEPFARRHWPQLLISWSRLLQGRWRDPMVGRDLLWGALAGIAISLLAHTEVALAPWLGLAERMPLGIAITPLNGGRHLLYLLGNATYFCVEIALCALFFRYLAARLWRLEAITWLAMLLFFSWPLMFFLFPVTSFAGQLLLAMLPITVGWLLLLWRGGLLPAVLALWVAYALEAAPLAPAWERWYSHLGVATIALVGLLAWYGFHTALAGRPLWPRRWLDADPG